MDNQIRYTITANDMLSGKLQQADGQAVKLESTMGGLNKIMGTLGIGFAVFKGLDFIKGGIEKVEEMHQATAQVQAALTSTNNAAGLSMKQLEESASSLASNTKFSSTDVFGMQSLLLTFTSVKDKIFNEAQPAIMDLATRMGGDLKGASIQVGKALNDPIQGMSALRRVGVSFSDSQKTVIKHLQETGDLAGAQKIILKELSSEFGGSAQAAFNADPLAQFNKAMGGFQKSIGLGAMALLESLKPALDLIAESFKGLGNGIKNTIAFFEKHTIVAEVLKTFLFSIVGIIVIYNAQQKLSAMYTAFTTASFIANTFATAAMTAGMAGASTGGMVLAGVMALINAVNPFVWIVIAIAAVVTAVIACYNHFETFRGIVWAIGAVIKEYVNIWVDMFMGFGKMLKGVFTLDPGLIKEGFNQATSALFNAGKNLGDAAKKGYKNGITDFNHDKILNSAGETIKKLNELKESGKITDTAFSNATKNLTNDLNSRVRKGLITSEEKDEKLKGLNSLKSFNKGGAIGGTSIGGTTSATAKPTKGTAGVQGNKAVTVNIQIGSLIHDFSIKTTNIQESATAIKEKVVMALTSAVNDSQLIAGN